MTELLKGLPRRSLIAEFSLWSANLLRLEDDLARIAPHCDILHVDVADGHFAPAMLFFPDQIAAVRKISKVPIHVHLMVADTILMAQIDQFAEAGADLISVHAENANAAAAIAKIKTLGLASGVVLQWDTPVACSAPHIDQINFLTLLGTAIGVKGQSLSAAAPLRLQEAATMIGTRDIVLAADGGIRDNTVPLLRAAGAQTVVLGSLAFGAPDLGERIRWLKTV